MTKQFPNPGPHFSDDPRALIPETQRRKSHLELIRSTHPLKSITLKCLRDEEKKRPSAHLLNIALSELKRVPEYAQSTQQAQENETSLKKQVEKLKKQKRKQQKESDHQQRLIEQLEAEQKELTVQLYQQQQQQQALTENNSSKEEKQRVLQRREKELLKEIKDKEQEIEAQRQEIEHIGEKQKELTMQVHEMGKQLHVQTEKNTADYLQTQHADMEKKRKLQRKVKELQQEIEQKQLQNDQLWQEVEKKEQEIKQQKQQTQNVQKELQQVMENVRQLGLQLREQHIMTEATTVQCQQLQVIVNEKERILQQKNHTIEKKERQLNNSKELVAQLQQKIELKDRKVTLLEANLSARGISGLQTKRTGNAQISQLPVETELLRMASPSEAQKGIVKLRLKEGMPAPQRMDRGAVVVDGKTLYVNPDGSNKLYSCQVRSGEQQWSSLPDSHYHLFSLAVIEGLLTSIGGLSGAYGSLQSNALLSLTESGGVSMWSEMFPPMPTARSDTASVTTDKALVVAGGWDGKQNLVTVEVMNIPTRQWSTAECLPHPFGVITGVIAQDQLYLGGGFIEMGQASKSVLTCSLTDLIQPLDIKLRDLSLSNTTGVWRELKQLPVTRSTLTTLGDHLLAIGGRDDSDQPTADIHCYEPQTNSWHSIGKMKTKRFFCLTGTLSTKKIFVIGGRNAPSDLSDAVEIGSLIG